MKLYEAPGGQHEPHYDTNAVTTLLYLTNTRTPTVVQDLTNQYHSVYGQAGDLLLMQGRRCFHCVPPMAAGEPDRITVPLNLYHPDDVDRPPGTDERLGIA